MQRVKWTAVLAGSVSLLALPVHAQQKDPTPPDAPTTVVVTGKTPEVVHRIDRSVYDLKDNPQATTGSVSDVLTTLPSVAVDSNGNVSVRGASVQVLVDGKPSAALKGANLATALQSMPANSVAKIEVITNPGAEFHTDAATVINIITRRASGRTASGTLIVNAGPQARYNATVSGEVTRGKWTWSGGVSLRQDQRSNYIDVDRITRDSSGAIASHFAEDNRVKVRINMTTLDAGVAYAAGEHDSLSLNGNITLRNRPRRDADHITFFDTAGNVTGDSTTFAHGRQYFNVASLAGTWKHKGGRDGETLSVQMRHEEDENLRDYDYDQVYRVPVQADNVFRRSHGNREMSDDLSADYVLPLGQDRQFKAGAELWSDRSDFNNLSTITNAKTRVVTIAANLTNRFAADQVLSSAYVDYQQPVGKWVIEGGVRIEALETTLRAGRTAPAVKVSNTQWAPSLFLSRPLTEAQKLHFSYSHRIERPTIDQLNPLDFAIDAQDIQAGNPYLKPGQTESFEAGYDYTSRPVTVSATLYARQMRDTVTDYFYFRNPGDTVLITSFLNAGKGSAQGLDLSLTLKPKGKLSYNLNSDIFALSQTAPVNGVDVKQSIVTHSTKATVTWAPTAADSLQVQALLNGDTLSAQGTNSGTNMLNLNYARKLSPRLKLVITGTDVLNSVKLNLMIRTDQFRDRTHITIPGQVFYIGLSYRLGAIDGGN